jgi:hypothetical protein
MKDGRGKLSLRARFELVQMIEADEMLRSADAGLRGGVRA